MAPARPRVRALRPRRLPQSSKHLFQAFGAPVIVLSDFAPENFESEFHCGRKLLD